MRSGGAGAMPSRSAASAAIRAGRREVRALGLDSAHAIEQPLLVLLSSVISLARSSTSMRAWTRARPTPVKTKSTVKSKSGVPSARRRSKAGLFAELIGIVGATPTVAQASARGGALASKQARCNWVVSESPTRARQRDGTGRRLLSVVTLMPSPRSIARSRALPRARVAVGVDRVGRDALARDFGRVAKRGGGQLRGRQR